MSYILDALKRADAERERGAVPGLHAQPAAMALPDEQGTARMPSWAWGLGGLGLALLVMLAWSAWRSDDPVAAPTAPGGAQQAPAQTTPSWTPPEPVQVQAQPRPPSPPPQVRQDAPRSEAPRAPASRHDATPSAAPATMAAPPPRPKAERTAPRPDPAGGKAADDAPGRVYALHELPDSVRRNLPQLVIGGAMYSDNPANRMLVINSQLFHEGDKLGQELTLETIKLKSAVLRYKDWRYSVTY